MHDQHMTPERWVGSTVHVGAVGDEPQADSRSGAARSVYEDNDGDDKYSERFTPSSALRGLVRLDREGDGDGSHHIAAKDLAADDLAAEETDIEEQDLEDTDLGRLYVPPAVEPAPPFLSLVGGFDETFDSIEDQWQERALCAQTDPEAFFPEKGGSTREAKRICLGCEVKDECLDYALAHDERFGIWGGLSERERRRLKRGIG